MPMPAVGDPAPAFAAPDQDNAVRSLTDYAGQWLLLYFYPRDNTPGCTKEARCLRDEWSAFKKVDATVVGVSADSVASHKKFAEKLALPFTLLADENKKMVKQYGVWQTKKMMGREYQGIVRTSFLINPQGIIAKVYHKVKPAEHAQEVLADIASFVK